MIHETIIVLAFRVINTGAVIGVVYYLYQKYGLSIITNKIKQEQDLKQTIEHEREFFNGMRDRVVIWKENVDRHKQHIHHDALVREIYLKERYGKRATYLRDLHINRQVIPRVIQQAQSALIKRFKLDDQGQKMT